MCACSGNSLKTNKYHIKEELIDVYLIDENIERKLYNFFDLAETSYEKFKNDQDTYQFIQSTYDAFDEFRLALESHANLNARIEPKTESGRQLASHAIDFAIAYEPMLALPLEYYEDPNNIEETDVFLAVNSISQYFCEVDLFIIID